MTNSLGSSAYPSITSTGININVVWWDNRDGNAEIYFKQSTNNGINWLPDTRLTNNTSSSTNPTISSSGLNIHIAWFDDRDGGNPEIYYKKTSNNGINWSSDSRLTFNSGHSQLPSLSVDESHVHLVWEDNTNVITDIFYRYSLDGGVNWETEQRLTNNPGVLGEPSISSFGPYVHVIWTDERDGNKEIYYKHNPTGNTIGIIPISNDVPQGFLLGQNFPNPFNPSTKIRFSIPPQNYNNENVKMVIYDFLGREVKTLLNDIVAAGIYEVGFDASDYANGVYFYTLTTGTFSDTKKMVIIK